MKRIISLLLVGIMGLQLTACTMVPDIISPGPEPLKVRAADLMANVEPGIVETVDLTETFIDGQMNFSVELFKQLVAADEGKNVLLSPTSVQFALAMTANGADNLTKQEMEDVLAGGMSIEDLNVFLYSYLLGLKNDDALKIANSIWIRDEEGRLTVREDFLQTNADYYGAKAYKSAFDNQTVQDMNVWVKEHTDGMIEEIIKEIPADAVMYLLNALTFEAEWQQEYEKSSIYESTFTTENGEQQTVEMMNSMEYICYEGQDVVGFKKNYKGGKYSFVALLPEEGVDIADYVQNLDAEELLELLNNPSSKSAIVNMPKFSYDYEKRLNDPLMNLGMVSAFGPAADLTKIGSSTHGNLFISNVIHKTFITVDELGTKAGAVTSVEVSDECAPMIDLYINLDRPFIYMIVDNETNLPIFIGTLMNVNN